jgi:hypothetical protein
MGDRALRKREEFALTIRKSKKKELLEGKRAALKKPHEEVSKIQVQPVTPHLHELPKRRQPEALAKRE